MDFALSAGQAEIVDRVLGFARGPLAARLAERAGERFFRREEWRLLGEAGVLGLSVPERLGGLGLGALDTALAIEALGRGCADGGLVFSACAHLFACAMPIVEHADDELAAEVVTRLASGEWVGANAITEAEAGSDASALRTTAVRDGDHYVLDGVKTYVTNAPVADVFVVYASTRPSDRWLGISAFVIDRSTPGLVVGEPFDTMGLASSPISSLYLEGCRVPASRRLGAEGTGAAIFKASMHWERACLFASYVGAMERQLEATVEHAKSRRQFRKPLGKHQAVAHRIADMKLRLDAARLLLLRACWLHDQGREASLAISLAKLAVSEAAIHSALDAIHLRGGEGFLRETGVGAALGDAVPSAIFSGTSEIQRDLVAQGLGL